MIDTIGQSHFPHGRTAEPRRFRSMFALAVLAWLLGSAVFLLVTTGMVLILLWRQFGSAMAVAIRRSHAVLTGTVPATAAGISQPITYGATDVHGQGRTLATRMQP